MCGCVSVVCVRKLCQFPSLSSAVPQACSPGQTHWSWIRCDGYSTRVTPMAPVSWTWRSGDVLRVPRSESSKSGVACSGAQAEGMECISGFCTGGGGGRGAGRCGSLEVRDRLKMLRMPFSVRGLERGGEWQPDHGL